MNWRLPAGVVAAGFLAWLTFAIWHAGDDVPPTSGQPQTSFARGHAEGRRLSFTSWSMDYDAISTSSDGTVATLTGVKDGRYFKDGKPAMSLKAARVVVNLITNDFTATGKVAIDEIDGKHDRHFRSDLAAFAGPSRILVLSHPSTIVSDGTTLDVAQATVNFQSGDVKLGRIVGIR